MNTLVNSNMRELLQTNGNCMTIESTKTTINKTLSQIKRYQERVRRHIEDNYVDFMPNHTSSDLYIVDGETLLREAENLIKSIGSDAQSSLNEANDELAQCTNELREATLGMQITYRILKIDDLFQCVEEANATKEYIVVLDVLEKLKELIFPAAATTTNVNTKDDVVMRVFQKCACYKAIKIKYHIQEHILQQNLTQRFERLLQFSEKSFPNSKFVTIKVTKDVNQLQDTVMALFQSHYKPTKLCEFLMWNCFEPILKKPVSLECTDDSEFVQLQLSYSLKDLGNRLRPSYKQVFEQMRVLLNVLSSLNVSVSQDKHVLTIVGEHINKTLLPMLVDECLMHAIPETMDDYQQSTLVEDVIQFEQHLADTFLINLEINRNLTYFCERYELYFKEYFLKKLLESAKEIMQKDLQDMTVVADKNTAEDVANNPLLFPRCMISKSTLDFVKLMERILRQTIDVDCGDKETKFVDAIAQMLNAYVIEMPEIHKKLMESIPQQSVIFYNNCMFLAHWLAENPQKGIPTLPALEKLLQTTGTKHLKMQIAKQQKIVMDILKEFDVSSTHTIGAMPIKLIRQCLRQLDLLKNVWQNVLPESLYNSTFCDILNDFAIELMRRILAMEDISATVANELSELIALILEKAPQLFREEHTVVQIKSWMRLQHLKIILNASLHEITEQWCEGAGILTATFKAEEIRHLIRALFQNTDRRAKALSKII